MVFRLPKKGLLIKMDSRKRLISLVGRVVPTVLSGVLWAVGENGRGWGGTELYNRSLEIDSVPLIQ